MASPRPPAYNCMSEERLRCLTDMTKNTGNEKQTHRRPKILGLKDLTREIQRAPGFAEMLAALKNGRSATLDGAWGSASALASAALALHAPTSLVILLAHVGDVDDFRDDVATFAGIVPEVFPAWEKPPRELTRGRRGLRAADARAADGSRATLRRDWWSRRFKRRSSRFRNRNCSPGWPAPSPSARSFPSRS